MKSAYNMNIILTALLSSAVFSSRILAGSPHHHGKGRTYTVGQAVRTSSGSIVGHPASSRPDVSEYLGIPFAKPPVGDLRFAAPQAYVSSGKINATAFVRIIPFQASSLSQDTDKSHPVVSVRKSSHQLWDLSLQKLGLTEIMQVMSGERLVNNKQYRRPFTSRAELNSAPRQSGSGREYFQ